MSTLSREAWKIVNKKHKYADKDLSDDAIRDLMYVFSHNFDLYSTSFYYTLSTSLFSSLVLQLLLDIPLSDMGGFIDFKIELPTPEEHYKGLLLKIVPVYIPEESPETLSTDKLLEGVMDEETNKAYVESKITKGVFGLTRYGYSYYDPPAVYEFIRSTLVRVVLSDVDDYTVYATIDAFTKSLGISEPLVRDVYERIQIMKSAMDYCILGVSRIGDCILPYGDEEGALIPYVDAEGNVSTAKVSTVLDIAGGCIIGRSIIGQCYLFDGERSLTRDENTLVKIHDKLVRSSNSRLLSTPLLLANYQRAEELLYPRRSIRTEHYGLMTHRNTSLKMLVNKVLGDRVVEPHTRFLYYVAVMDLYGKTTRPRGWGNEAYKVLSRDELLGVWRSKWIAQGLDGSILDELFSILYDTGLINNMSKLRQYEREIVRLSRGGSP